MSGVTFPNFFPWLPQSVEERFNNGWTFGNVIHVTHQNSRAPLVEREIISKYSYGRQLGWLTDAVLAIASKAGMEEDAKVKPLVKLADEVKAIKEKVKQQRATELLEELRVLKKNDPKAWADLLKHVG
jgi:hypothetical protein